MPVWRRHGPLGDRGNGCGRCEESRSDSFGLALVPRTANRRRRGCFRVFRHRRERAHLSGHVHSGGYAHQYEYRQATADLVCSALAPRAPWMPTSTISRRWRMARAGAATATQQSGAPCPAGCGSPGWCRGGFRLIGCQPGPWRSLVNDGGVRLMWSVAVTQIQFAYLAVAEADTDQVFSAVTAGWPVTNTSRPTRGRWRRWPPRGAFCVR